jgi:hypothetical protein
MSQAGSATTPMVQNSRGTPLHRMVGPGIDGWNRIESTVTEGLAATNPLDSEPRSLHRTVDLNGLIGVPGTTWMKSASRTEKRGQRSLVHAYQAEHQDGDGVASR